MATYCKTNAKLDAIALISQQTYRWLYRPVTSTAHHLGCLNWLNAYLALWE
jgi:hypothetical protein